MRHAVLSALAALTLVGCYQTHGEAVPVDTVRLEIWARSDLPPRTVSRVRITIGDLERIVALPDDGIPAEPIRLLEVEIAPGEYRLEATLLGPNGGEVATQALAVRVFADQSVTLLFTVGCLDVICAPGEECIGGDCVDECERFPERCQPCTCESDGDCALVGTECGASRCLDCLCQIGPDDELCPAGAFCSDTFECVFEPSPMCACEDDFGCGGFAPDSCVFEVCDCICFPGQGMCETGTVCHPDELICRSADHPLDFALLGRVDRPEALRRYRVFIGSLLFNRGNVRASELAAGIMLDGPALPTGDYEVRVQLLSFDYVPIAERSVLVEVDGPTRVRFEFR